MTTPPRIQRRALHHMRQAQAQDWHDKRLMCDYAQAALEAEGYDETNAASAIEIVWSQKFATQPPN